MSKPAALLHRRSVLAGLAAAGASLIPYAAAADGRGSSLNGLLDAAALGVSPSTTRDQTKALQAAIDEAARLGLTLFLPAGEYRAGRLTLPAETRILSVPGATRIAGEALSLRADKVRLVRLSGLLLDGMGQAAPDASRHLVEISGCPDVAIEDCRLEDAGGNAIALTAVAGRIDRCAIAGAGAAAILSVDAEGLSITGNRVSASADNGILVHRSVPGDDETLVSGNHVSAIRADSGGTGEFGNGINVYRAHGVSITGNTIADCAFSAIRSNGGSNVLIGSNQCHNSGETAIYSEFVFEGAVIEGNLVDGAAIGISIANFNEGGRLAVCTGNLVRNLRRLGPYPADEPGFGVGIAVEADSVVSNNVVEGAPLYGLHLGWGPYLRNVSATGNILRDCAVGIAVSAVEGSGRALIGSNIVSGSPGGAIRAYRWSKAVTGDLLRDPSEAPVHVTLLGNVAG